MASRPHRQADGVAAHALYAGVRAVVSAVGVFGVEETSSVIAAAGRSWARSRFNASRHARTKANLAWAYPGADAAWIERVAVASYEHLFLLAAELAALPRLITPAWWDQQVRLGEVGAALDILASGEPAILIAGHVGNWEALGMTLAALGAPLHALYRPFNQKPVDNWVRRVRAARGLSLLDKFGAMDAAPALVQRGACIGFIADQNAGDRGLFVPFFDRLASAYKSIGLLAIRYEMPVICGVAQRLALTEVERFEISVSDIIRPEDWEHQPDPLFYITARYRRAIETMVRQAPGQYLWMHRAWKSRPRHERLGRPFPDSLRQKIAALPWMTDESLERLIERSERDAQALRSKD